LGAKMRPLTFLPGGATNAFAPPPNFYTTQSQSSVIKLRFFIFLPPKVSDYKPRVKGVDTSPQHFRQRDTNALPLTLHVTKSTVPTSASNFRMI